MGSKICAVIDYGMGNLHSAHGALQKASPSTRVLVTSQEQDILSADHVVLPGVGAIRDCMAEIQAKGIDRIVRRVAETKPVLGICVGLQAMMTHSEENNGVDGMGVFSGRVTYFGDNLRENGARLKVPHMGWNTVEQKHHPLWKHIADHSRFYFVHSYYVDANDRHLVKGTGFYGQAFDAALGTENIFAVQFHPEKSHRNGLQLLENFLAWDGQS